MRAKSYDEVREEIERYNKELAEAVFHGQIEIYYIEKFENQYALIKKLEDESSSMLSEAGNQNIIFNHVEYLEKQRLIKDLESRKSELTRNFYPLIKGRVIKIFRGHDKMQIGDELSFNLRSNFDSFIAIGDDNPPWEYETLSRSKFMEILLKKNSFRETTFTELKSPIKIEPFLTRIIEVPTNQPILVRKELPESPIFNEKIPLPELSKPLACTRCGHPLMANIKFCGRCGLKLW
jgi:hypothetical protein